ncbi:MAG: MlaD family protein [Phenylobacterium sp.]
MEKNANYALVGLSTLILLAGLIIFGVWLARFQFNRDYDLYDIVFQGPVRGLTEGGEVNFNGIKVGEVTEIRLDPRNPSRVRALARVNSNVPIKTDSFATLEPQGITGVNYVQISAGSPNAPLLKDQYDDDEIPVLRSQRSTLADLLEGGGTVLTRTIEALDRINRVMSDQNIKTFSTALSDTQAVTGELRERKAIIADAQKALRSIDEATVQIKQLAATTSDVVGSDGRHTMQSLSKAADDAAAAARDARALLSRIEGPTADFATNGLPAMTSALTQLQETAESLDRLLSEVQASPQSIIGKAPSQELEVAP